MLDALLAEARGDDHVVGVVVFGSRGKGAYVTELSDWDVFVVVNEHRGDRPFVHGAEIETVEVTLDQLRHQPAWNRYSLAWVEPQLDETGEVAAALLGLGLASLLDAQESIPWFLEFGFAVHGRLRPHNKWLAWELETHPLP